jgi:hypothetical protein
MNNETNNNNNSPYYEEWNGDYGNGGGYYDDDDDDVNQSNNGSDVNRSNGNGMINGIINKNVNDANNRDIDLEIVGLLSSTNGRSCSIHSECGSSVCVGDILQLKKTVIEINIVMDEAVKLTKITDDGIEGCTVAFLPRIV